MAKATRSQRRAVRNVLWKQPRFRHMINDYSSIGVLMNLTDRDRDEQREAPFTVSYPEPTRPDSEVVQRCGQIAGAYEEMRREIQDLALPAPVRRQLRRGLREEALSWVARRQAWAAPGTPDVEAAAQSIKVHIEAAADAYARVRSYLPSPEAWRNRNREVT